MNTPNFGRSVVCLIALALAVAACGSDATTTTRAAESIPAAEEEKEESTNAAEGGHDHDLAHSEMIDVASDAAPAVSIEASPDAKSGVNVRVEVTNLTIAPESVSTAHVDGEGHMHLIVDGEKVQRFYNEWIHVDNLSAGEHTIEVELNANTHAPYATGGERISASQVVVVGEAAAHDHDTVDAANTVDGGEASVALTRVPVAKAGDGNNFAVSLSHFDLAPEKVGGEHVANEGHLHLFIDGVKQGRIYGTWFHVPELGDGEHTVEVELSANNHATYVRDGEPVRATVVVSNDSAAGTGDESVASDTVAPVLVEATYNDGTVMVMSAGSLTDRVEVGVGDMVRLVVTSDTADHVHVHGYDIFADLVEGEASTIDFVAAIPGIVEIELEDSGLLLFELSAS